MKNYCEKRVEHTLESGEKVTVTGNPYMHHEHGEVIDIIRASGEQWITPFTPAIKAAICAAKNDKKS